MMSAARAIDCTERCSGVHEGMHIDLMRTQLNTHVLFGSPTIQEFLLTAIVAVHKMGISTNPKRVVMGGFIK